MAQRALMDDRKPESRKRGLREQVASPMRKALGYLPGGKTIGKWVVPNDLQSLESDDWRWYRKSAVGAPFVGAELGGTVGGVAQGRGRWRFCGGSYSWRSDE